MWCLLFCLNFELFKEFKHRFYFHEETVYREISREVLGHRVGMFNMIDQATGYKIDFILLKDLPYEVEKFSRKKTIIFEGINLQVISVEDLIISKLQWIQEIQSQTQMKDICTLWTMPDIERTYVLSWVKKLNLKTFDILK